MVYPELLPLMRTPRLPVVDWTDVPRWFKWTRPFRRKTKSGFFASAITFQLACTSGEPSSLIIYGNIDPFKTDPVNYGTTSRTATELEELATETLS